MRAAPAERAEPAPKPGARKSLGLCMIVRSEAAVIDRCLASVRDRIDYWVICDTGSTDDTPQRIEAALAGVPGELHRRPWVDFGHNRSEAVALARGKADYLLLIDADMVLEAAPDFDLDELDADAYLIRYEGELDYRQALLVRGDLPWRYVGATHEYLDADVDYSREPLDSLTLLHLCDGANRAAKFERDRDLLRAHLESEPDDSRGWFYLAQTYFDLGEWERAIEAYRRRAAADGWEEETWYAGYKLALARHERGDAWPEVLAALLESWQARPRRLEPLYVLARRCREAGDYPLGHLFSRPAVEAPYPDDILFVEREVYRYLLAFEHAICCFWLGDHATAIRTNNDLLDLPDLPADHVEAVIRNRRCSLDLRPPALLPEGEERPRPRLVVVVPFYNPGVLLERAIASLDAQQSPGERGFEVVLVDDGSTDGYGEAARRRLADRVDARAHTFLSLPRRFGFPEAVRRAVAERAAPDDVVVVLSGDDRLASPRSLTAVAEAYAAFDCEATYGQYEHAGGRRGAARPFPDGTAFERFAGGGEPGAVGPLLTFRAGLLQREGGSAEPARPWARPVEAALAPALFARAGFERVALLDETLCVTSRFRWGA